MFNANTKLSEIRRIFKTDRINVMPEMKDFMDLIAQYSKGGQDIKGDGLSYSRALDFLFFIILGDNVKDYLGLRSENTDIRHNVAGFLLECPERLTKKDEKESISWDDLLERNKGLFNNDREDLSLNDLKNRLNKVVYTLNSDPDTPHLLNDNQIKALENVIDQICKTSFERYLSQEEMPREGRERNSWCREERQIALFLYDILLCRKNHDSYLDIKDDGKNEGRKNIYSGLSKIFGCEFCDVEIVQVYYEASLIRDYFHTLDDKHKRDFDEELLKFCVDDPEQNSFIKILVDEYCKDKKKSSDDNTVWNGIFLQGAKKGKSDSSVNKLYTHGIKLMNNSEEEYNKVGRKMHFACMMMNATPDILVVFKRENSPQKYALILECKYESDPNWYEDYDGKTTINQKLLQEMIMSFLFGKNCSNKNKDLLTYYCKKTGFRSAQQKQQYEQEYPDWHNRYDFCNSIITSKRYGFFNNKKDLIKNLGVKEIDFLPKGDYPKNDTRRVFIPAEDLINCVYN